MPATVFAVIRLVEVIFPRRPRHQRKACGRLNLPTLPREFTSEDLVIVWRAWLRGGRRVSATAETTRLPRTP